MSDYQDGFDDGYEFVLEEIAKWIERRDFEPRVWKPVQEVLEHLREIQ